MFVTLPANTPVDLYTASKIPVTTAINIYNPTDVPVVLAPGKDSPTGVFDRIPLSPKTDGHSPSSEWVWAIAVQMDTTIVVEAVQS